VSAGNRNDHAVELRGAIEIAIKQLSFGGAADGAWPLVVEMPLDLMAD
jgi:hypothetical protein